VPIPPRVRDFILEMFATAQSRRSYRRGQDGFTKSGFIGCKTVADALGLARDQLQMQRAMMTSGGGGLAKAIRLVWAATPSFRFRSTSITSIATRPTAPSRWAG